MSGRVLIVDDSKMERLIITTSIKRRLFDVEIFENANGENILETLMEEKIQVCILDIMLPKKNGFEILKEIKENPKTQDVVVLVCTGMSEEASIEKALSLGAYDYFAKPLSEEVINIALPLKIKNAIDLMIRKEEIIFLSYHDNLTGLFNRRYAQMELENIDLEKNLPIGIIMGDANGLKLTNDAFGHEAGDKLLIKIAGIMQKSFPKEAIIARIGGDEFCMILPSASEKVLEHSIAKMKSLCDLEIGEPLKPNISFGFAIKESTDQRIHDIYRKAEDVMYSNKIKESTRIKKSILKSLMQILKGMEESDVIRLEKTEHLCLKMGKALHIGFNERIHLKLLAKYHDIGLTAVSLKNEKEMQTEGKSFYEILDKEDNHCELGFRIATALPDVAPVAFDILSHHEKWDGSGFPQKLKGIAIPLNSRILFTAEHYIKWIDEFEREQQQKPEFVNMEKQEFHLFVKKVVLQGMKELSGTYFDPELVQILDEIEKEQIKK